MLNVLRESFKQQPYLKVVLALTGVGLVGYLGSYFACDGTTGGPSDWAARVNDTEISARDLRQRARLLDDNYRRMFGQNYDQIRKSLRLGTEALGTLIEQEVVLQDARRMGFEASPAEVAGEIVKNASFHDASGQFVGKERYRQMLDRAYPGGHLAYERGLAQDILVAKWRDLVALPLTVGDVETEQEFRRRTVKTVVDYVLVSNSDQKVDDNFTEDELRAWHDEHAEDYRRQEGRKIRYVVVDREAVAETIEVTDGDIRERYDANEETYRHPDERRARHILFRSPPDATDAQVTEARTKAEQTLEKLRGGADFADLARDLSEDQGSAQRGGDLGFFPRGSMVPQFEEAAFGTPVGELAPVTASPFGFHVIEVTGAREPGVAPLDEVRDSIRRSISVERAQEQTLERTRAIRKELLDGASLEDVATRQGLVVEHAVVTPDRRLPELDPSPEFLRSVVELAPDDVSQPLRVARGMAVVASDEIVPAEVAPLDDVRDRVRDDLAATRATGIAMARAQKALREHQTAGAAAAALGLEIKSSGDLAPGQSIPGVGAMSPDFQRTLFRDDIAVGEAGVVEIPAGALLYAVTRHDPFDPEQFARKRDELQREVLAGKSQIYVQDVVDRLRARQDIEINRPLVMGFDG